LMRSGSSPDVLYRAAEYPLKADVNIARTVPYSRFQGDGSVDLSFMDKKPIKGQIELGVDTVSLVYRQGSVQAKATDRALLAVDGSIRFTDNFGEGGWGMPNVALDNVSLTLPDSTVVHPRRVEETDGFFGGTLVFDVPAGFTTGTIKITPGRMRSTGSFVGGGVIWGFTGTYSYPVAVR
jgi:hypothetical protein